MRVAAKCLWHNHFDMQRLLASILLVMAVAIAAAPQTQSPPGEVQPRLGPEAVVAAEQPFSLRVVEVLLSGFRDGLVGQNAARVLRLFAGEQVPEFPQLADDFRSLTAGYDSIRVRYHIVQSVTEADGQRGAAMVDLTIDATPRSVQPSVRRNGQVRFEFARSGKQWKIVGVQPRALFSGF